MKYFVKLLPTKDKIYLGNLVTNTAAPNSVMTARALHDDPRLDCVRLDGPHWMCESDGGAGDIPVGQLKKLKLFLCSRDIQVGDKVRTLVNIDKEFIVDSIEIGSGENHFPKEMIAWNKVNQQVSYWHFLKHLYKVIGEISPDATWVKEGDEFDFLDLAAINLDTKALTRIDYFEAFGWHWLGSPIQVKGPCGHFH